MLWCSPQLVVISAECTASADQEHNGSIEPTCCEQAPSIAI